MINNNDYPAKKEWFIAGVLFMFLFMSYCYIDTASIIRYEAGFAESLVKGEFKDLYGITYNNILYAKEHNLSGTAFPTYDLPLNLVLGVWGIPLYLYRTYSGAPDIAESFGQMLYGKSVFLPALIITMILVYKICLALGTDKRRALWGTYIYMTSSIVTTSIAIVGQCDVIGMTLILAGLLAFIKKENRKFMLFFTLSMPFKMYAMFFFLPLMLLREKKIHMIITKLFIACSLTMLCGLSLVNNLEALKAKVHFNLFMLGKLVSVTTPLLHEKASVFVILFGALCIWCFLHEEYKDDRKNMRLINFVALLSVVTTFISFSSYPYWFVYLAPYLAVSSVFSEAQAKNVIALETLGMSALTYSNYVIFPHCYDIQNTVNMFMHRLLGNPVFRENALTMYKASATKIAQESLAVSCGVYIVCMLGIVWICRPDNDVPAGIDANIKQYARVRFLINSVLCLIPVVFFVNAIMP